MGALLTTPEQQTSVEALASGQSGSFVWVTGNNFSGRSEILSSACKKYADSPGSAISIPPEIRRAISGQMENVEDELRLHFGWEGDGVFSDLAEEWGLSKLRKQDPFSLSGGEQALLTILAKLSRRPRLFALDGPLEQLDPLNLRRVLAVLTVRDRGIYPEAILLSHNGTLGCLQSDMIRMVAAERVTGITRPPIKPPLLNLAAFNPSAWAQPVKLELRGLTFGYRKGLDVVKDFDASLEPGRLYRIAGPNGSGKSTLARLLIGDLKPCRGIILVNGRPLDVHAHPGSICRLHLQSPTVAVFLDSVEAEFETLPEKVRTAAAEFSGLSPFLNSHPLELPFVLRKRLTLTFPLFLPAPWLIFDEPTLGQDAESCAAIADALRRLAHANHGVLLITHSDEFAEQLVDETISLPSR